MVFADLSFLEILLFPFIAFAQVGHKIVWTILDTIAFDILRLGTGT